MASQSLFSIIKEVMFSWQVLFISFALVLYLKIVFHAARGYKLPKFSRNFTRKRKKPKDAAIPADDDGVPSGGIDDELGLE